ncbi:MAG: S8 family serine peptidase [Pleurocapsa minor GSE-CHR-MK-17-07R]|jgi:subtilisin family serine protease|nr:S8 family serine peptidase [Pleurocapsa minor GSE-CHR-MK 17-07R]
MSRREKAALFAGFIALILVLFGVVALVQPNAAPEAASLPTLAQLPSETSTQPSTQTVTLLPATSTPDAVLSGMLPTEPPLPATETPVPTATPLTPTRPAATATTVQPPVVTAPPSVGIVPVTLPQPEPLPPPSDTTLVVTFAEDTTQAERAAYIDSLGAEVASEVDALNTVVLTVPEGFTASSAPDEDIVLAAEPDYYASVLDAPALDDPLAGGQYGLSTMGLAEAWAALPADAPRIVVAVIDTGICAAHPDLLSRVLPGYDFVGGDADPADEHGHGCAVSGVIAAQANNGVGIAGVAPNAMIMPLRVLDASGVGTYSRIAEAIVYATDNGARIINLSLGGFNASAVLEGAVDYALSRGVLVVAAAGNTYGGQTMYPAAYQQTIAVGAHDATLLPAAFNPAAQTDVLAAGVSIPVLRLNGSFGAQSGTSFAAPHVSGALAIALGQGRELSLSGAAVLYLGTGSPLPVLTPVASPTAAETPQADASAVPPPDAATRRETYQGLTTELSELFRAVVLGEAQAQAVVDQIFGLQISGSNVLVTIYLQDASFVDSVSAAVTAAGGTVSDSFSYVMDASLPIDQLVNIGAQPGVMAIDANRPPITLDDEIPANGQSDGEQGASAQAATTQGVAASNANVWHASNYRGSGIRVAVIDAGFFDYTGRQASGELPPGARLVAYTTPLGTGSTHGTNVAEIVYDMAPDSTIYLAVPTGLGNFGNLVQDLACNQGVKVIQSSIGYMAQTPADGTGFFAEAVTAARNCGALYVQAAGNAGVNHWDLAASSGNFGPKVNEMSNLVFFGSDTVNRFSYSNGACYPFSVGMSIQFYLRWNGWPTTNQDYDLYLARNSQSNGSGTWTDVTWSVRNQQSGAYPYPLESISHSVATAGCYGFRIVKYGNTSGNQTLNVLGYNLPYFEYTVQLRSLLDEATSPSAFAVAALDVTSPYNREYYSSWGPAYATGGTINDGAAIQQPRIAGYANVSTSFGSFNGTSAAAPHVSGAAALVFGAYPGYSPAQVASFLEGRAVPGAGDSAGYDNIYGFGRLYLGAAPSANTNLLANGDFTSSIANWQTYGNIMQRLNNGVFEFYHNTSLGNVRPSILQVVPSAIPTGTQLELRVDLGNSGPVRKRALIFVVNQDWTDLQTCSFWIPPYTPLRTYVLQGRPTTNWTSAQVAVYANPADNTGWLQVDNVFLTATNGSASAATRCIDSAAPAPTAAPDSGNLIVNGGFTVGLSNWITYGNIVQQLNGNVFEFYHNTNLGSVRPSILQNTGVALAANAPLELQLQLGNSGPVRKRALIILFEHNWTDLQICSFWIPPYTPLQTYAVQTHTTQAWSNASLAVYASPADNTGWLQVDNVSLRHRPSLALTGTNCSEPGAGGMSLAAGAAEVLPTGTASPTLTPTEHVMFTETLTLTPTPTATATMPEMVTATAPATTAPIDTAVPTATLTPTQTLTEVQPTATAAATETDLLTATEPPSSTIAPTLLPTATLTPSWTPQPPPGPNLVTNGSFDTDVAGWTLQHITADWSNQMVQLGRPADAPAYAAALFQTINAPTVASQRYEMMVQLANASASSRTVTLMVRDALGWDAATTFACTVTLPPDAPMNTYTLRYRPTVSFGSMIVALIVDGDALPALALDNVIVRTNPNLTNNGTECTVSGLGFTDAPLPVTALDQASLNAYATAWAPVPTATLVPPPTLLPTATAESTAESTAEPTAEPSLEPTPDVPTPESVPPTLESPTPEATPST